MINKKTILKNTLLLFFIISIISCSKDNTDLFSFTSKKEKIANNWIVVSGVDSIKNTTLDKESNYSYKFSKDSIIIKYDSLEKKGTFLTKISIKKDGNFTFEQNYSISDVSFSIIKNGTWRLLEKNKNLDKEFALEKKDIILFTSNYYKSVSPDNTKESLEITTLGVTGGLNELMIIEKLSNKEIVFRWESTKTIGSTTIYNKGTFTCEPE